VSDSSEEAQQKLAALDAKYADDLTRSEAQFVEVAESLLGQWRTWWRDPEAVSKLAVEARLHNKFLMCFPLAAHAMNHACTDGNLHVDCRVKAEFQFSIASSTEVPTVSRRVPLFEESKETNLRRFLSTFSGWPSRLGR
jgi:hypothetical protein